MKEPWIKNAPQLLVVNSILAALSGILIGLVIQDENHFGSSWYIPMIPLVLSFLIFVLVSEQITTALDEKDVKRYVFILLLYNLGVLALFVGLSTLVFIRYKLSSWYTIIIFPFIYYPWIHDFLWILNPLRNNKLKQKLSDYLKELTGEIFPPEPERNFFTKPIECFFKHGLLNEDKLPHQDVFARLTVSDHGVGVFALKDIPVNTNIFLNDNTKMIWIDQSEVGKLEPELKKLYDDFCVVKGKKYGCPESFNQLTVGWYLNNDAANPNVFCDKNYDFYSLREIKIGEELTVDYSKYSDDFKIIEKPINEKE